MKTLRFLFTNLFCLLLANSLAFGAFSTHSGIDITRTFDSVSTNVGSSITITVNFTNSEAYAIKGFFYTDHIPQGLIVDTLSVKINGQETSDYLFESGIADDVYLGCIFYRWVLEIPTGFAEDNPINPGASVEIVYSLKSNQKGIFYCEEFNWIGYYQDASVGLRTTFGHSENDERQIITFKSPCEMDLPEGWSMISLPMSPDNANMLELFPDAVVIFSYKKGIGYNRITEGEDLKVGKGYWIYLEHEQSYNIIGQPIYDYWVYANEDGWEMIGGCSFPAQYFVDICNIGLIFRYVSGIGYEPLHESENLSRGQGYWINFQNISDPCKLTVNTGSSLSN